MLRSSPGGDYDIVMCYDFRQFFTFIPACLANLENGGFFHRQPGLRVGARLTEDEFLDVAIQNLLQLHLVVWPIDNVTLVDRVNVGLSAQFNAEVFGWVFFKLIINKLRFLKTYR